MAGLFSELKRRNVVRVGVAYIVVGWVAIQIAQLLFEAFGTPDWVIKTVIVLIAIGFPFALLFAWAFEVTPEGLKKTREVDLSKSITHNTGRKLDFVIIGAMGVALAYFIWERQAHDHDGESLSEPVPATVEESSTETPSAEQKITETGRRSIAVLPFVNMSSDQEQEYFADGLTEEILNSLAKAPDLLVAARTSSFGFKGSTQPIPDIAANLGVDHVLEGSVRRGGDTLRITAQLIRASDGFHLWSETFDRTMEDIIAIQEEIAVNIARALETAMDPEALAEMMSTGTTNVEAYEWWLKGQGARQAADESGDIYEVLLAKESWERAIELDPEFSRALARLSLFWTLQMARNQITSGITELSHEEMRAQRDDLLERAIRFEKDDVTRLLHQAGKALNEYNMRYALRLFNQYRQARPNDYERIGGMLYALRVLGMHDAITQRVREVYESTEMTRNHANQFSQNLRQVGERELMRAIAYDAIDRFGHDASLMYQVHRLLLWAGDIDGASRLVQGIRNSDLPEENIVLVQMRQLCADRRTNEALPLVARAVELRPDDYGLHWIAHKIIGDEESAQKAFEDLIATDEPDNYVSFLTYSHLDVKRYPQLVALMAGQGLEDREIIELPYRCLR